LLTRAGLRLTCWTTFEDGDGSIGHIQLIPHQTLGTLGNVIVALFHPTSEPGQIELRDHRFLYSWASVSQIACVKPPITGSTGRLTILTVFGPLVPVIGWQR
jgi:hypothetical protein